MYFRLQVLGKLLKYLPTVKTIIHCTFPWINLLCKCKANSSYSLFNCVFVLHLHSRKQRQKTIKITNMRHNSVYDMKKKKKRKIKNQWWFTHLDLWDNEVFRKAKIKCLEWSLAGKLASRKGWTERVKAESVQTDQGEGEGQREEEQHYCHVFQRSSFYLKEKGSPLSKSGNSNFLSFSCFFTRQAVTRASSCHGSLREEGLEADARYFNKALTSPDLNGVISEKLTGSPAGHPGRGSRFPGLLGD